MSNIVLLSGSSHPAFVDAVADILGVKPAHRVLAKFSSGETKCEIRDSVRGMDVYIVQTFGAGTSATAVASAISNAAASATTNGGEGEDGGVVSVAEKSVYDGYEGEEVNGVGGKGKDAEEAVPQGKPYTVNDYFVELCIMISACKTGSAKRVTAVMPLFPYSRQPDLPFSKIGAPLFGMEHHSEHGSAAGEQASDVKGKGAVDHANESGTDVVNMMGGMTLAKGEMALTAEHQLGAYMYTTHDYENPSLMMALQAKSGHKQFTARAGSLMADLLTCAGVDRVLTCDLHENAYQGFFDIPVDNLHARPLLKRYIQQNIPNYHDAVIVSPDAGGAKRATAIADSLSMAFAMIHKERRSPKISAHPKATMMLVGKVSGRVCILIDDLADTASTITRAANLLKREGAVRVVALLTHGVLSGDAVARVEASALDRVVVTNTVPQEKHAAECAKLEVLDISGVFAEAVRRVHYGESVSALLQEE